MKTIRIKIYKFSELNSDAQKIAIAAFRDSNLRFDLDPWNEGSIEQINEAGFEDAKLQYSLSYCQGDGLSFSASKIKNDLLLSMFTEILGSSKEKTAKLIIDNCSFECTGNKGNHYCFASRGDVNFEFDDYNADKPNIHELVSKVETKIADLYMALCKDLENSGYKEIEYRNSDECMSEDLVANDYDFTKNGKIYNF